MPNTTVRLNNRPRYARHYSDLARLLEHEAASTFIADEALCDRVARWKSLLFPRAWARYDHATHGSFKLVPPAHRQAALARDYAVMRPMFLTEPPPFGKVLQQLAIAEQTINA